MCRPLLPLLLTALPLHAAPDAQVVRTPQPPTIDGKLDEPAWASAPWQSGFTLAGNGDPEGAAAPVQTRFKVLVDEQAAYVGVECDEPNLAGLKAECPWRDGAVWSDDCVEIFFDPGNEGRYYHQVMVNSRGTILDLYGADYGLVKSRLWNGAFTAAGSVDQGAGKWSVEVVLPFGALVLGDGAASTWLFNVTRERHAGGELQLSTWALLRGDFHQPKLFGSLHDLPADYRPFRLRVGEPKVDVARAASGVATLTTSLTVRNETGAERKLVPSAAVLDQPEVNVAAEAVTVPADGEVTVTFPALQVRGTASETDVVFSLRDAADQRLLRAVVRNVASDEQPLRLTVLEPCYRNNIYATQDVREIVFNVEPSAQVRQATDHVACRLTNADGKAIAERTVPVADLARPVHLPAADLALGRYTLHAVALAADGKEQAVAATTITKLPPPPSGHEVRIDEHRRVLVDGRPLLAIGWYGGVPTDDPRADVVALQNITTPDVITPPATGNIQQRFEQQGIYTVVSVENGRLYYSFNLWQQGKEELARIQTELHTLTTPSDDLKRLAQELVDTVRGTPGLLGYYIADEPEINDVPAAYLEHYYQYLCELDPYHPVFVTNDTIDGIVTHGYKCADVIDPDPYNAEWDYVPKFLEKVNEVATRGKATYVTLWHSTGETHFNQPIGSAPPYSYRVCRNQYFASVAYGATGFTAYTSAFFLPEIEYRYGLPHIWRELRLLEPAILAPPPAQPVTIDGAADLAAWAREVDGKVYLLLVNHKGEPRQAKVTWPGLGNRTSLHVMSEGRKVQVVNGSFSERFAPGDVHVYTDDPAAEKLPTTAEIEAELAQRKADAIQPGNLLHLSRGVKARSSEGYYAPWFEQYYYYAINGLTDDQGWYAYGWQNKPAWLELTLPEPRDVGRIVLYTPNLKDYQLDLVAPDGTTRRVDVTGNQETLVVHHLKPAVPCLKLRLTATATRPSEDGQTRGPRVDEIEAYASAGDGPAATLTTVQTTAGPAVTPLFAGAAEPNELWSDDFTHFETAAKYLWSGQDTKWVLNPQTFIAEPKPGGGITVACRSPQGYDSMTHLFPYDPAYRFFQVDLSSIAGEGYRFANVGLGNSSGKPGYRGAVNTNRPGIYTVDLHYVHEAYRSGADKVIFLRVSTAGSKKLPDGTAEAGPRFTFDWLRLVRRPVDGLIVTLADGSPLPEAVGEGDTLHFELYLEQPAADVVVEVQTGPGYSPLAINGEPYVQLRKADEAGRVWTGEVKLSAGTGKFEVQGYPAVFRAVVNGGAIQETYASAFVSFR